MQYIYASHFPLFFFILILYDPILHPNKEWGTFVVNLKGESKTGLRLMELISKDYIGNDKKQLN